MSVVFRLVRFRNYKLNALSIPDFISYSLEPSCLVCLKKFSGWRTLLKNEVKLKNSFTTNTKQINESIIDPSNSSVNRPRKKVFSSVDASDLKAANEILKKYPKKINDFSSALKIPLENSVILFTKYPFLKNSKTTTIVSKIDFLIGKGIPREQLLGDLWILTYTSQTLEKRIQLLNDLNMEPIKPWLLRCSDQIIQRMSMNRENNRLAMGSSESVSDYLKERLSLSDPQLGLFASRCPPVMRVKVAKIKEILDFLYAEGFTPYQVYQTPRILCHSLLTIQSRLREVRAANYELRSLGLLCKSNGFIKKVLTNFLKEKS